MTDDLGDYAEHKVADLTRRMREAKTRSCARSWACKLVKAKHEAKMYAVQGELPEELFEGLVEVEMKSANR